MRANRKSEPPAASFEERQNERREFRACEAQQPNDWRILVFCMACSFSQANKKSWLKDDRNVVIRPTDG
ncbi:MAG TPA: hypothetical protein DIS62_04750 [Candidatus Kerfeldbacteria bacterium]|nr:hypothetical protein [Candidatus Kerfeldbacteria bacterium]